MRSEIFAHRDGRNLVLDIFAPDVGNGATVVLLHGGALLIGQRQMVHTYAAPLVRHGFTVVVPSYRLLSEARWPAPLEDVAAAIDWVRRHAVDLRVSPDRIAVQGFSAGAMLALGSGMETGVAAVVSFFAGPEYNPEPGALGSLGLHLGPDEVAAAAPLRAIREGYPPTLLLHGTADTMIPFQAALTLFEKLRAAGANADLRLYHGLTHEFAQEPGLLAPIQDDVALFLNRSMVDTERFERESCENNPFAGNAGPPPFPPYHP